MSPPPANMEKINHDERGFRHTGEGNHHSRQIRWKDMDPTKFFFLNAGANFIADAVIYPIDVIRTRMQVQGSSIVQTSFHEYNNSFDALKKIVKSEGPRGLFKGFAVSETGYVASHTVYYGVYEVLKQGLQNLYPSHLSKDPTLNVFWTTAIAGGVADLVACGLSVPSEVATTRLQIQGPLSKAKYSSGIDVLMQVYRTEGVRGMYRGLGATLLRNVPNSAMWWGSYEICKNKLHNFDLRAKLRLPARHESSSSRVENEDPLIHVVAGVVAAVIATTIVNPIDVAKTRLQSMECTPVPLASPSPSSLSSSHHSSSHSPSFSRSSSSHSSSSHSSSSIPSSRPAHAKTIGTSPITTLTTSSRAISNNSSPSSPSPTPSSASSPPLAAKPPPSIPQHVSKNDVAKAIADVAKSGVAKNGSRLVPNSLALAMIGQSIKGLLFGRHNTMSVLMMMLREEGIKSFGKGLFPSLLIATPYSVLSILLYEEIKKWCVVK